MRIARLLLIADTHLGFDLPLHPRLQKRRRGDDFFANFELALEPARRGQVDLVVHGGDLLYRSRVPSELAERAMAPLLRVAELGVPVVIVPGNHERSRIPLSLWTQHPNVHIFHEPGTHLFSLAMGTLAVSGFPFCPQVCARFVGLVGQTGHSRVVADAHVLCLHQTVEGAQVGLGNYTFRRGADVVRGQDILPGFAAVVCGHIHRAQVLTRDLCGRPLSAPVIYPGSIERTSFAERAEEKGYMQVALQLGDGNGGLPMEATFVRLPTRPMVRLVLEAPLGDDRAVCEELRWQLAALDPQAVVRVQLGGPPSAAVLSMLTASRLRELAPRDMDVSLVLDREIFRRHAIAERPPEKRLSFGHSHMW